MSKRITQSYAPELRAEAIKLVLEQGMTVTEAATQLNMNQRYAGVLGHTGSQRCEIHSIRCWRTKRCVVAARSPSAMW